MTLFHETQSDLRVRLLLSPDPAAGGSGGGVSGPVTAGTAGFQPGKTASDASAKLNQDVAGIHTAPGSMAGCVDSPASCSGCLAVGALLLVLGAGCAAPAASRLRGLPTTFPSVAFQEDRRGISRSGNGDGGASSSRPDAVVVRVYDVRDLLADVADSALPPDFSDLPSTQPTTSPASKERAGPSIWTLPLGRKTRAERVKDVVQLIENTVESNTWKETGGDVGSIREWDGDLVVVQTRENHRQLANLLGQLRELLRIQVTVEMRLLAVSDKSLADAGVDLDKWAADAATYRPTTAPATSCTSWPRIEGPPGTFGAILDEVRVNQLLRAARAEPDLGVVAAPRLTLFNQQRAFMLVGTPRPFVSTYRATRLPSGETRYEPRAAVVRPGCVWDQSVLVSADRHYANLTLCLKVAALTGVKEVPWPGRPAGSNLLIEEPQLRFTELRTLVSVPDGGTLLLAGLEDPDNLFDPAPGPEGETAPATQPGTSPPRRRLIVLAQPRILLPPSERGWSLPPTDGATRPRAVTATSE